MWIKELHLRNLRSFENESITFSKGINVLVGPNNAGKSTIIKALLNLQFPNEFSDKDVRNKGQAGTFRIVVSKIEEKYFNAIHGRVFEDRIDYRIGHNALRLKEKNTMPGVHDADRISANEPNNFIYPFLTIRKNDHILKEIRDENTRVVEKTFRMLTNKIDRISDSQDPHFEEYIRLCESVLGFRISTFVTGGNPGKQTGIKLNSFDNIPIEHMGAGSLHIIAMIENLCMAKEKLFLIEELENDLHPKALKKLLDLIIQKSGNNQFIISTHSNIVVKHLGASPETKLFSLTMQFKPPEIPLPLTTTELISDSESRRRLLEDLGYDFSDYELWKGWLFLEESSAEEIVRDYLIPWFAPPLTKLLRTYSARSLSQVEEKFHSFNKLFVFLHLEPKYKNMAWVVIDDGEQEDTTIVRMKNLYVKQGWKADRFSKFKKHNFEEYYPSRFSKRVAEVLGTSNKRKKIEEKSKLLNEVKAWINSNAEEAKIEFQKSAQEVIQKLQVIQKELA